MEKTRRPPYPGCSSNTHRRVHIRIMVYYLRRLTLIAASASLRGTVFAIVVLAAAAAWAQMPVDSEQWPAGDAVGDVSPGCADGACDGCECAGCLCPTLSQHLWVRGEYLMWWTKGVHLPPLVTTSPPDTPDTEAGILGRQGTQILFGNGPSLDDAQSGGRATIGWWFDTCQSTGIEANYMRLGRELDTFRSTSAEYQILARPFFNTSIDGQDASLVAYPNLLSGEVSVENATELQSAEALFRRNLSRVDCNRPRLPCRVSLQPTGSRVSR